MVDQTVGTEEPPTLISDESGGTWVLVGAGIGGVACKVPTSDVFVGGEGLFVPLLGGLALILSGVL